ncbi:MAG: gliding motility protein GldN [Porphyromonas sp.]|nr:gliding motility protein GldN [Porphyromonas sp.]
MKLIPKISSTIAAMLVVSVVALAQGNVSNERATVERQSSRNEDKRQDKSIHLSTRAEAFNELLRQNTTDTPWERVIYRKLDLTKEANAPLYYPVRPRDGMRNLFSVIFDLLNRDAIAVYEYMDGYESFDEEHKLKFKDFLDRTQIMYSEPKDKNAGVLYEIEPADIPSNNVRAYYIKEQWYLNPQNSNYDLRILALCPILSDVGDYGEESNTPLFWIPYETLRPYVVRQQVILSSVNNVRSATVDDFFRLRLYKGDIVMASNLLDRSIAQYCNTPDSIRKEQNRIEKELKDFEKGLYVTQDSAWVETASKGNVKKQASMKRTSRTPAKEPKISTPKVKAPKAKAAAPSKAKSSAARSSRRRY